MCIWLKLKNTLAHKLPCVQVPLLRLRSRHPIPRPQPSQGNQVPCSIRRHLRSVSLLRKCFFSARGARLLIFEFVDCRNSVMSTEVSVKISRVLCNPACSTSYFDFLIISTHAFQNHFEASGDLRIEFHGFCVPDPKMCSLVLY